MVAVGSRLKTTAAPVRLAAYAGFRAWRGATGKAALVLGTITFCFFYGASFAVFGPSGFVFLAVPIIILTLLVIWALPDLDWAPRGLIEGLLYLAVIAQYVWPNYLAIAVPGLPWITVNRLIGYPLFIIALICISSSREFRSRLVTVGSRSLWTAGLFGGFLVLEVFSIVLSKDKGFSLNKIVVVLIDSPKLLIGAYLFMQPGQLTRFFRTLWAVALFVGLIGLWQYRLHHVPWAGHIPAFLRIDDPAVQEALNGSGRAYTNIYRVNSTFVTSLGLSEFQALIFPFVIYTMVNPGPWLLRLSAAASLPFMFYVVLLTGSRLGVVGCLLSGCLYPAFLGLRRWRRERSSLLAPAVSLTYPILFGAVMVSTLFIGRLKTHIWGGGAQKASSDARLEQLHQAIPLLLHNPFGYGIGRGAATLGYAPFGFLTIDSYYLLIALEFGVCGFVLFYGLIVLGVIKAGWLSLESQYAEREQGLAVPICVALISFIIIKGVFAQPDNVELMYLMLVALMVCEARRPLKESSDVVQCTLLGQRDQVAQP